MTVHDPLAHLSQELSGNYLIKTIYLRSDIVLFPIPRQQGTGSFVPAISAARAMAGYRAQQGVVPGVLNDTPVVFLALLTDKTMRRAGSSSPMYVRVPVWVIAYHDVKDGIGASAGGIRRPGSLVTPQPRSSALPSVNVVGFVEVASGKWLFDVDDTLSQPA
jgi:hypothetical protein